ncbi:MAG TPA: AMP-binding protein [Vicinamibacteria bacterium]|nr:AMP-binding protein [Vicinamibacteria bacterium]
MKVYKTLLELIPEIERISDREAVLYDRGYRTEKWSGRELSRRIAGATLAFDERGYGKGDRILIWSENRPEWMAVFWGALARGITVVPIDSQSSPDFVNRVQNEVSARAVVHGTSVEIEGVELEPLPIERACPSADVPVEPVESSPDDVVQILYTSGTTGKPKGIVHRHRHLVANLNPIRTEIEKYALYAKPFQPIRFLELLPLSHVFGQFTGMFLPLVMKGSVAFVKEMHPSAVIETIRKERISVLVAVPRFLSHLHRHVEWRYRLPERTSSRFEKGLVGGFARWWQHREVHSAFGWKFWAIVSGGARLPPDEEAFWFHLGFVLVQGYGLTETSSVVSTNHPLHPTRGSLGKAVGSQQIRLAEDGEILVRGDNVSWEVFGVKALPGTNDDEEWLRTGDIGEMGPDGTLYYKGRKKDVIVGADGLNVYPVDVETVLNDAPEVSEAVVIGRPTDKGDVIHAVLLLAKRDADPSDVVQRANRRLERHQRIREWTVWEEEDFPRTSSTLKIKRQDIQRAVESGSTSSASREPAAMSSTALSLLARHLGRASESIRSSDALSEDLGLTSLDRIELMTDLEEHYGIELSEGEMARIETVDELESWLGAEITASAAPDSVKGVSPRAPGRSGKVESPTPFEGLVRYSRSRPLRFLRDGFRRLVMLPLFRRYLPLAVEGSVKDIRGPVIFAPNHTSSLDTIALIAALPPAWQARIAPAISQDTFRAYLEGSGSLIQRLLSGLQYWLAVVLVNVFPLPQKTQGVRKALQFAGRLANEGYAIVIFPEGERTPDGETHAFRPGVGLMAVRLQLPVVPVHIDGLYQVLPVGARWPKPGRVRVRFGAPLRFAEDADFREAAGRVEREVRNLA